jgi:hypothetical protein
MGHAHRDGGSSDTECREEGQSHHSNSKEKDQDTSSGEIHDTRAHHRLHYHTFSGVHSAAVFRTATLDSKGDLSEEHVNRNFEPDEWTRPRTSHVHRNLNRHTLSRFLTFQFKILVINTKLLAHAFLSALLLLQCHMLRGRSNCALYLEKFHFFILCLNAVKAQ